MTDLTMFRLRTTVSAAALAFVVCVPSAFAQGTGPAADGVGEDQVDAVVVTGSRIARRDLTSPSPIITATNEDLAKTGQVNIEQSQY